MEERYSVMRRNLVTLFSRSLGVYGSTLPLGVDVQSSRRGACAVRCGALLCVSMNLWRAASVVSGRYIARPPTLSTVHFNPPGGRSRQCTGAARPPVRRLDGPRRHGNARLLPWSLRRRRGGMLVAIDWHRWAGQPPALGLTVAAADAASAVSDAAAAAAARFDIFFSRTLTLVLNVSNDPVS